MVTRNPPLAFPTSPPPPLPTFGPPQPHLDVDSADVPPIPIMPTRQDHTSNYQEMGNPWAETEIQPQTHNGQIPDLLKVGSGRGPSPDKSKAQAVPDILRPGWSGENTPRSSLDSQRSPERDWWDDDDDDDKQKEHEDNQQTSEKNQPQASPPRGRVPASSQIKRKPVGLKGSPLPSQEQPTAPPDLKSNNPFRRPSASDDLPNWGSESKGKGKAPTSGPLGSHPPTDRFGALDLGSVVPDLSAYNNPQTDNDYGQWENQKELAIPPPPQQAPPPIPIPQNAQSPFSEQPPLVPVTPKIQQDVNPWAAQDSLQPTHSLQPTPSPIPFDPSKQHFTTSTDHLLDRGHNQGSLSLGDELKALPNASNAPPYSHSQISLLDDDEEPGPPLPQRRANAIQQEYYEPPEGPPPTKPPRPAVMTSSNSDTEVARMLEQRNETYAIKHFSWYDHRSGKMRRSSMLTQNKNGPCPLLALVNALILGAPEDTQAALDDALTRREQVSLGIIVETLMDELLSRNFQSDGQNMPDVDELNRFLMRLRTGMNANPRFVPATTPAPNLMDARNSMLHLPASKPYEQVGTFESTQDIKLYAAFPVKLLHGWLPTPDSEAAAAFSRSAPTYEDAQAVQFGEEELEYKLSNNGLTRQEQQLWEDITCIKEFLRSFPTQLTPTGLESVQGSLDSGEFAILFRNDHFSTIYKHPQSGRLYTLITDAGYADRDEIIWESLVDINGTNSEFFSGDFNSVSHGGGGTAHSMPHSQTDAANPRRSNTHLAVDMDPQAPLSPQEQQEQHDADFAMALQLQEEEEQRIRQERSQAQAHGQGQGQGRPNSNTNQRGGAGGRRSSGNIPIPLRGGNPTSQEIRPLIPPRTAQSRGHGVNRPADANSDDAPPAYEEAAKGRPYLPPLGSPLHPATSTGASTSSLNIGSQTTGTIGAGSQAPQRPSLAEGAPGGHRRRTSAYGENNMRYGDQSPDYVPGGFGPGYGYPNSAGGGASGMGPGRPPAGRGAADRDCIVM